MAKPIVLGTVFSKLTVVGLEGITQKHAVICRCECGN